MTAHLPVVDPARIISPVAVIRGEFDGIATMEDLWDFYRQLPTGDNSSRSSPARRTHWRRAATARHSGT